MILCCGLCAVAGEGVGVKGDVEDEGDDDDEDECNDGEKAGVRGESGE